MKDGNWIKSGIFEKILQQASRIKWKKLTFSVVVGASVIAIEIGSLWESADEGSVGAKSNAWDSSSAPRADWDAMVDNCEKGDQKLNISLRGIWIVYLSSWWSRSTKSFPTNDFLGCPLDCFALWRLVCHDHGDGMSFHQFLQWRCGQSYSWDWAWWLIIYRMPLPIQAWRIEFSVLKRSVRTVSKRNHRIIF